MAEIISSNASVLEYGSPVGWPLLHVFELVLGDAVCEISVYCLVTGPSPFHWAQSSRGDPNAVFCASLCTSVFE